MPENHAYYIIYYYTLFELYREKNVRQTIKLFSTLKYLKAHITDNSYELQGNVIHYFPMNSFKIIGGSGLEYNSYFIRSLRRSIRVKPEK